MFKYCRSGRLFTNPCPHKGLRQTFGDALEQCSYNGIVRAKRDASNACFQDVILDNKSHPKRSTRERASLPEMLSSLLNIVGSRSIQSYRNSVHIIFDW